MLLELMSIRLAERSFFTGVDADTFRLLSTPTPRLTSFTQGDVDGGVPNGKSKVIQLYTNAVNNLYGYYYALPTGRIRYDILHGRITKIYKGIG